jgi:hypothetical protein
MKHYSEVFRAHDGKVSDKWESYLSVYDSLLASLEIPLESVLELGVQNGGSLEVWAKVAPEAKVILGIDVNPLCGELKFEDSRIRVAVTDGSIASLLKTATDTEQPFSIIVDDASHLSRDIIENFVSLWPLVASGGKYIVEDLATSYWPNYDGGLYKVDSSMNFLKVLSDLANHQHWTSNNTTLELFEAFKLSEAKIRAADFGSLESIEFRNSICVISKKMPKQPKGIGKRLIVGAEAAVDPAPVRLANMEFEEIGMKPEGSDADSKTSELWRLREENAQLAERIEQMQTSFSWRTTRPFRTLTKGLNEMLSKTSAR